ncbi:MAG: PSD1 and planctomycete cytochrome C domain-containing protein [Verrucomicrobiales bacterium]
MTIRLPHPICLGGARFAIAAMMALAFPAAAAEKPVDFAREVLPVLSNKCFVCHGPDTRKKDLVRLDSFEAATADLGGYRAIDPAALEDSEIIVRLHDADDPMPPDDAEKQLTEAERDLLTRWVRQGGTYAKHWAFVPPVKAEPAAGKATPAAEIIDAFVERRLAEKGIGFAPEAEAATRARRAALVLTGLPPDPEQLAKFVADPGDDAFAKLVDGLMESPRFGEHQARYWLDAVRYGDTHGLHLDNKRGIYPYRDWVVKAFNDNLPLDQFITWQLAGDLLPEPTLAQRVATGYVRMNPTTSEGGAIAAEFQAKNNFDRVETLGTVFLGMTFSCARCHTHKYDPVTQTEYYELLAFFNNTSEGALDGNKYDYKPVINAPADADGWAAVDQWERDADEVLRNYLKIDGTKLDQIKHVADPDSGLANKEAMPAAQALVKRWEELEKTFTTTLVAEELPKPRETRLLDRGEYDLPKGEPLEPSVIGVMGELPDGAPKNRLGLAGWLTSREHPLVARVLVNQIWGRVFGNGLVRTPEDFGLQGEQPTHPKLLDWLAVELHDSGWDLRHLLRLMLTSRTFQQSSAFREGIDDPENRMLARGPRFRLDAEVIRDTGLWASQLLDPHRGGEGVKPYQPAGMWSALMHPASNTKHYERDKGERLYRRSLYVYWKRTSPHPMMTIFDAPNRESSCVRRSRSNTPLQSLGLLNETQRIEMARKLAERLLRERDADAARLDYLFTLLASRPPSDAERAACDPLLAAMRDRFAAESGNADAQKLLQTGDAPRDESLDAAEVAAWTQVAATVMASDAAILVY